MSYAKWTINYPVFNISGPNDTIATKHDFGNTWGQAKVDYEATTGKWYFEIIVTSAGGGLDIGVCAPADSTWNAPGSFATGYSYRSELGNKWNDGSDSSYGDAYTTSRIGVALDLDNGKIFFRKDGTWQNSGDPAAGTGFAFSGLSGIKVASAGMWGIGDSVTLASDPADITGSVPSGFAAGLGTEDRTYIDMGIGYSISHSIELSAPPLRTQLNLGIGFSQHLNIATQPVEVNLGIGFKQRLSVATQPLGVNLGIGFSASLGVRSQKHATVNMGIGYGVGVTFVPQRLVTLNSSYGFKIGMVTSQPTFMTLNKSIGYSIGMKGNVHAGMSVNAGIGYKCSIGVDNNANANPSCGLPEFSEDRWC